MKNKLNKGTYGYLDRLKAHEWKKAALFLSIPIIIFLVAWAINGTRNTVVTVMVIVGCLPGCNQVVHALLASKYHSMDKSLCEETEKLKVLTAPIGIWCACRRCREDGELFFYNEGLLLPLMDEIKKSDYVSYTVRRSKNGSLFMVVHDGMDVLGAILPVKIVTKEYLSDLAEFEALCAQQYYRDQERSNAEDGSEEAEQIGMEDVAEEDETC